MKLRCLLFGHEIPNESIGGIWLWLSSTRLTRENPVPYCINCELKWLTREVDMFRAKK